MLLFLPLPVALFRVRATGPDVPFISRVAIPPALCSWELVTRRILSVSLAELSRPPLSGPLSIPATQTLPD